MNKWQKVIGFVLVSLLVQPAFALEARSQQILTLGTANVTGVYFPAGGAICRMFNMHVQEHGKRCVVESTGGSISNLDAIRDGYLDVGVSQSDWQYHAYHGTGSFEEKGANKNLRSIFSLHSEPFTVVARADSDINSFDDLKGKRINVGNVGSGMKATMDMVMRIYGWKHSDFPVMAELKAVDQSTALCDNQLDAIIYAAGHPNGAIQEITRRCNAKLVDVSGAVIDKLIKENPFYSYVTIPGGMYRGNPNPITTFGVKATLVTSTELDTQTVYELTKAVFNQFDEFKTLHPVFSMLTKQGMIVDGNSAPLHKGALAYYKEAGLYPHKNEVEVQPISHVIETETGYVAAK